MKKLLIVLVSISAYISCQDVVSSRVLSLNDLCSIEPVNFSEDAKKAILGATTVSSQFINPSTNKVWDEHPIVRWNVNQLSIMKEDMEKWLSGDYLSVENKQAALNCYQAKINAFKDSEADFSHYRDAFMNQLRFAGKRTDEMTLNANDHETQTLLGYFLYKAAESVEPPATVILPPHFKEGRRVDFEVYKKEFMEKNKSISLGEAPQEAQANRAFLRMHWLVLGLAVTGKNKLQTSLQ